MFHVTVSPVEIETSGGWYAVELSVAIVASAACCAAARHPCAGDHAADHEPAGRDAQRPPRDPMPRSSRHPSPPQVVSRFRLARTQNYPGARRSSGSLTRSARVVKRDSRCSFCRADMQNPLTSRAY